MNIKKTIIMLTLSLILFCSIIPQTNANDELNLGILDSFRIYNFNTSLDLTNKDTIPSSPIKINVSQEMELKLDFSYELAKYFPKFLEGTKIGKWVLFRDQNHNMTVNITFSIIKKPSWCELNLSEQTIQIPLSTTKNTKNPIIHYKIKEGTNAFLEDEIIIKAEFKPEDNWGLKSSQDTFNFTIISEFQKSINISYSYGNNDTNLFLKPGENIEYLVNLSNNGNGDTLFEISQRGDKSDNINVSIDQESITIAPGKIEQLKIIFNVSKEEKNYEEEIEFTVITKSAIDKDIEDKYLLEGEDSFSIDIIVEKEEDNDYLNNLLVVLFILVVIIVLVIVVLKLFKKK